VKVLCIALPAPDHLTDQLYTGLHQVLGIDNVVDFPPKPAYRDPQQRVWFLPQIQAPSYTKEEILSKLEKREFDFVCIPARAVAFQTLASLWGRAPFPPLILLDGEEDTRIRHDLLSQYPIRLYFKRDYVWGLRGQPLDFLGAARAFRWNRALFERTYPLPLGVALETIPPTPNIEKTVDVSYTGRGSHRHRNVAVTLLRAARDLRFEGGVYRDPEDRTYKLKAWRTERLRDKLLPDRAVPPPYEVSKLAPDPDATGRSPYFDQIYRSKVALCVRGGGFTQPIRYYEIVVCRTMLLSDIPYAVIPNNFEHKRHAIFFRRDFRDLVELARYYARHDAERESIVEAGYQHLLKHHTCERRAEYFLDICRKAL
jgi:hypothetical protein